MQVQVLLRVRGDGLVLGGDDPVHDIIRVVALHLSVSLGIS